MARLVVLRGDTVERELELSDAPVKIGRGQKNDVVLEDPMKGISREHAEIRFVDGRYVLVDRESENGIWVAGRRESKVVLDPATVASIGPFRLKVIGQGIPAAAGAVPVPKPAPVPKTEPTLKTEALPTRPKPTAPTSAKAAGPPPTGQKSSQWWLIGGGAAAVIVVGIVAAALLLRPREEPVAAKPEIDIAAVVARANRALDEERCQDAFDALGPALSQFPDNADIAGARERAEGCRFRATLAEPVPDIAAELQKSAELIATKQCKDAQFRITNLLSYQPDSVEAADLKQKVDRCLTPVAPPPPPPSGGAKVAVAIPPDQGGLAPHPNELDSDYRERVRVMRIRYDEAVASAAKDPLPRVISTWEGLLKSTSSNYLDVASRLAEARKAAAANAQRLAREATQAENSEAYDDAIAKLREARSYDPSMQNDAEIARIQKAKIERGERACREARQQVSYRPNDAAQNYRLVLKLLPTDHECYPAASKYATTSVK